LDIAAASVYFTGKNYAQFFNDNGLAVKEGNIKAEIKRQTQLKRKAAPKAENPILPKRHQHPVEVAIPPTHHQCPL